MTVAMELDSEFDAKRRKIGLAPPFAKSANGEYPAIRRLSDLSDLERRDFFIRTFITNENQKSAVRVFESDSGTRETKLAVAREDLAAIGRVPSLQK